MKISYKILSLFLVVAFVLTGCNSQKSEDRIEVYDKNQTLIREIKDQKELDYFSDLIETATEENENKKFDVVTLPKDAEILYEYKFISKHKGGKETEVSFDVYDNYQFMTLKGIPIISPLTWKLSDMDYEKLKNPENK